MRRIKQFVYILNQDRLFIDGMSYLKEGDVEHNSLGTTNRCTIKATLVEENYVFNSGTIINTEEVLLPSGVPIEANSSNGGLLLTD